MFKIKKETHKSKLEIVPQHFPHLALYRTKEIVYSGHFLANLVI